MKSKANVLNQNTYGESQIAKCNMKRKTKKPNKQKIHNGATKAERVPPLGNSPNGNPKQFVQMDADELDIQLTGSPGKLQRPVIYALIDRATKSCLQIGISPPGERQISSIVEKHLALIQHEKVLTTMPSVEASGWKKAKE